MRLYLNVDQTVVFFKRFGLFALFLADCFSEELDVHIIADVLHMTVLFRAEDIARAAQLEVAHRNLEARTEFGELANGCQAFLRDVGQHLAAVVGEVSVGAA